MKRHSEKIIIANEKAHVIQPLLVKVLGRSTAHVLQNIHYSLQIPELGKIHHNKKWIYNSYENWQKNIQVYSSITIRRAIAKLEKLGILLSETLSKKKSDRTKWYTIDYNKIKEITEKESNPEINILTISNDQNDQIIKKKQRKHDKKINSINSGNAKTLLSIWNEMIETQRKREIALNAKRSQFLLAAFKSRFGECLHKWKNFCASITTSDFLMGRVKSSFKASLDWVLRFDIIDRILEGDFGVKLSSDPSKGALGNETTCLTTKETILSQILSSSDPLEVKTLRQEILKRVGEGAYLSWFTKAIEKTQKGFLLKTEGSFGKNYLEAHFRCVLETFYLRCEPLFQK